MNKRVHRLVFDRRRGMRVPAAEHVRSSGKAAGGQSRAVALACAAVMAQGALAVLTPATEAQAQTRNLTTKLGRAAQAWATRTNPGRSLPVLSGERAGGNVGFEATDLSEPDPTRMVIKQRNGRIVINWSSFNVGTGHTVEFQQPEGGSALNKIWDFKPSVIRGNVRANGELILENQNAGFIFDSGARVEAGRFVATALSVHTENYLRGLRGLFNGDLQSALAFGSDADTATYVDAQGKTQLKAVSIEHGAEIKALAGGDVLMIAPTVYNEGRIETPSGQTVLAAGQKVYLMSTGTDQAQRGLMVAVDAFKPVAVDAPLPEGVNTVEQAGYQALVEADGSFKIVQPGDKLSDTDQQKLKAGIAKLEDRIGAVVAEKGSINLVGAVVRQNGLLSATTAVKGQNGAISLVAMQSAGLGSTRQSVINGLGNDDSPSSFVLGANVLGRLEIGGRSLTEVAPSANSTETQFDSEVFIKSRITAMGSDVRVGSGAQLRAKSGQVDVLAAQVPSINLGGGTAFFVPPAVTGSSSADGSTLLIEQGAVIDVSGVRDVALPMSRNQASGRLFKIELADQPVQRSGVLYRQEINYDARNLLTVGDGRGIYAGIRRTAQEWSTLGGNIRIEGAGNVLVEDGAALDISGGSVRYDSGTLRVSRLSKNGRALAVTDAAGSVRYDTVINTSGETERLVTSEVQGYVEGVDAGSLTASAGNKLVLGTSGLRGDVVVGPRQRAARTVESYKTDERPAYTHDRLLSRAQGRPGVLTDAPHLYGSLRPMGGVVNVGTSYVISANALPIYPLPSIALQALPPLTVGSAADLGAWLAALPAGAQLGANGLVNKGLSALNLAANSVAVAPDVRLDLGGGGALGVEADQGVQFAGAVVAPGGSAKFKSSRGDITFTETARIDLAGQVVDDREPSAQPSLTVVTDGGDFSVEAGRSMLMAPGSEVKVSAGAWRNAQGEVALGEAGSVDIKINRFPDTSNGKTVSVALPTGGQTNRPQALFDGGLQLAGQLEAFGFGAGGSFSLDGLRTLTIAAPASDAAPAGLALASGDLVLQPAFFSEAGFGQFTVLAKGDVTVKSQVKAQPTRLVANFDALAGSAELNRVSATQSARPPAGVSIDLRATGAPAYTLSEVYGNLIEAGHVRIEAEAGLDAGWGGSLSLTAAGSVDVAGQLVARAGKVVLSVSGDRGETETQKDNFTDSAGYVPEQAITLRQGALIDVSGVDATYLSPQRTRRGEVLAGGKVQLGKADGGRAKVITEAGSKILADGATGQVATGLGATTIGVSRAAGSIEVGSANGLWLAGSMSAKAPDASADGGSLAVSLSRGGRLDLFKDDLGGLPYPSGPFALTVVPAGLPPLQAVADLFGTGSVSASSLQAAGLAQVELRSDGRVVLAEGTRLDSGDAAPWRSVKLNAPVLEVQGNGRVEVEAHRVALGNVDLPVTVGQSESALPPPTASGGDASLLVQAALIELHGPMALQGTADTQLKATLPAEPGSADRRDGEIRLIGRSLFARPGKDDRVDRPGQLAFQGALTMQAGQLYATTGSTFALSGQAGDSTFTLLVPQGGASSSAPLSALGRLTLAAQNIEIDGVIRQPFGTISVLGETAPILGPNSVLSVSGEGLLVPAGTTTNETVWSVGEISLEKSIRIEGPGLTVAPSSTVQAQRGGDLLTWELLAGVGGSTDTLARQGLFAVLPGYTFDFAPHDSEILAGQAAAGTTLAAGDRLTVTGDNQVLAPGSYTLLPARYGILPGAKLVSVSDRGIADATAAGVAKDDGSVVAAGYIGALGSSANGGGDTRMRFLIEPEATFRAKSDLAITKVSDLLSRDAASRGEARPTLPGDAGRVSLQSTANAFDWAANYQLAGGQFDLSMPEITLLGQGGVAAVGQTVIRADKLSATGAASILLGGIRTGAVGDTTVSPQTSSINVLGDITAGELWLVATKAITLGQGITLTGNVADDGRANQLTVKGGGVALGVSGYGLTSLQRDLAGASGQGATLALGDGVTLRGAAVQIDSSDQVKRGSGVVFDSASLGLGASKLSVGGAADADALLLQAADLNRRRVTLRATQGIDFVGSQSIGGTDGATGAQLIEQFVLDAPVLRGLGTADDRVQIQAEQVVLRHASGALPASVSELPQGQSSLGITARPTVRDTSTEGITLDTGSQHLAFEQVSLSTTGDAVLRGAGITTVQKDLTVSAARLTGAAKADRTLLATKGTVVVKPYEGVGADQARTLGQVVGAGARLAITGQRILHSGVIDMPSGEVRLEGVGTGASGESTVVLAQGSQTLARGYEARHRGQVVAVAPGGTIDIVAQQGLIEARGTLDVSSPDSGTVSKVGVAAGSIALTAVGEAGGLLLGDSARLVGGAGTGNTPNAAALSGSLKLDLGRLLAQDQGAQGNATATRPGSLDDVARQVQSGGFSRELSVRVREGDLALSTSLSVGRVVVTADAGSIRLREGARIDTTLAADRGGVVQLWAQQDVALAQGAVIDTTSTAAGARGGDVLLAAANGRVELQAGSLVKAGVPAEGSAQPGRVVLRVGAEAAGNPAALAAKAQVAGQVQAGEVLLEAVQVVDRGSQNVTLDATLRNTLLAQASALAAQAPTILAGTGLQGVANAKLRVGTELRTAGDITLNDDWNLYRNQGAAPINLTLRAGRDLKLNGSLSDGFETAARATAAGATPPTPVRLGVGDAGSLRLVAGADLASANSLATRAQADRGDLILAGNKLVRTTTGSIDAVAGRNIVFSAGTGEGTPPAGSIYVAGRTADALVGDTSTRVNAQRFTQGGGRLTLEAGQDITAPAIVQGIGNWFLHTGLTPSAVAWASDFDAFRMPVGSFGGGDVRVTAGRNISNLAVVAPTSARTLGNASEGYRQQIDNGGDVLVRAGGDVLGGMYFMGRGQGNIEAGGSVLEGQFRLSNSTVSMGAVLGLMDGDWRVQARGDVNVATAYNPTAIDGQSSTRVTANQAGSYLSYSDAAAVSLLSVAGDALWRADRMVQGGQNVIAALQISGLYPAYENTRGVASASNSSANTPHAALNVLPPTLEASALSGNVGLLAGLVTAGGASILSPFAVLAPSPQGDLRVYARDSLKVQGTWSLSDAGAEGQDAAGSLRQPTSKRTTGATTLASVNAADLRGKTDAIHADDLRAASLWAGQDITFSLPRTQNLAALTVPKALNLYAGRDLVSPDLLLTHQSPTSVSTVEAGRNLLGQTNGNTSTRTQGFITLAGPGELQVQAGRTLDLRNAGGIRATGDGARIRVAAGAAAEVDVDAIERLYLAGEGNAAARAALVQYVQGTLKLSGLSYAQALAYYREMAAENQLAFAQAQLMTPRFVQALVRDDQADTDVVWTWVSRAAGVPEGDVGSALYSDYLSAKLALVSFVARETQTPAGSLSFDEALTLYRTKLTGAQRADFIDRRVPNPQVAMGLLAAASVASYADGWKAQVAAQPAGADRVSETDYDSALFRRYSERVLFQEIQRLGSAATDVADSTNALLNDRRAAVRDAIWVEAARLAALAGVGEGLRFQGDLNLSRSMIQTRGLGDVKTGGIDLMVPGGQVLVGSATATANDLAQAVTPGRGITTLGGGSVRSYSLGDFQVASQKVHIVGSGDMVLYSAEADIDSGRGSNTAVALPPREAVADAYGVFIWRAKQATVGSGLAIFENAQGVRQGKISLLAPRGEVRALDAFIDAPEIELAGPVVGGDNLKGGVSGAPATPVVSVNVSVNSGLGTETAAGQAQAALSQREAQPKELRSLLTVDVLGIGDSPAAGAPGGAKPPQPSTTGNSKRKCEPGAEDCKQP